MFQMITMREVKGLALLQLYLKKNIYTSKTFSLFGVAVMIHLFCYTAQFCFVYLFSPELSQSHQFISFGLGSCTVSLVCVASLLLLSYLLKGQKKSDFKLATSCLTFKQISKQQMILAKRNKSVYDLYILSMQYF